MLGGWCVENGEVAVLSGPRDFRSPSHIIAPTFPHGSAGNVCMGIYMCKGGDGDVYGPTAPRAAGGTRRCVGLCCVASYDVMGKHAMRGRSRKSGPPQEEELCGAGRAGRIGSGGC